MFKVKNVKPKVPKPKRRKLLRLEKRKMDDSEVENRNRKKRKLNEEIDFQNLEEESNLLTLDDVSVNVQKEEKMATSII